MIKAHRLVSLAKLTKLVFNTEPSILLPAPHTTASISPAHPNIALGYMPNEFYSGGHEQAGIQWHLG